MKEEKEKKSHHKKKELEVLKPSATVSSGNMNMAELMQLAKSLEKKDSETIVQLANGNDNMDTLFNNLANKLYDDQDIDMKTEYNEDEAIFASAKATFISKHCNVPIIDRFIRALERKKLSKNRQSRSESVIMLQRRQEELDSRARQQAAASMQR